MTPADARARFGALPPNLRGAAWMIMAAFGFSMMAALVKLLGQRLDTIQITFFRNGFGLLWLLPFAAAQGRAAFRTSYLGRHLWRAAMGGSAMLTGFYAVTHMPLATATSISFATPMFMIVIATFVLRETVRGRRWAATLVGFGGVLVMLRPGAVPVDAAALAALANALFVAIAQALVKTMPISEKPLTMLMIFAMAVTAFLAGPAILVWQWPTPTEWAIAAAMGGMGITAQGCIIRAFQAGEASVVSPLDYTRLIFATLLGYAVFAEIPDAWTFAGAGIVIASAVYIARHGGRPAAKPAPDPLTPPPPRP